MSDLPQGTVTFMLTDIEGSTRLWEQHPQAMGAALMRHDMILASQIQQHNGVVIKNQGEGDSFFAVFPRAADALNSAVNTQLAFQSEVWPDDISLRVRISLHTGEAFLRDNDYFGRPVNRCARLRAIAHGGQIVLSQATASLAQDALPEDTSLRDLGTYRLRDLERPERVFQIIHPELPSEFPPLKISAFENSQARALAESPQQRFQTPSEMRRKLEHVLGLLKAKDGPILVDRLKGRWTQLTRWGVAAAAAAVILALTAAALTTQGSADNLPSQQELAISSTAAIEGSQLQAAISDTDEGGAAEASRAGYANFELEGFSVLKNPANNLPKGTPAVDDGVVESCESSSLYAWVSYQGVPVGTLLRGRWFRDNVLIAGEASTMTDSRSGVSWFEVIEEPIPPGRYEFELSLDDGAMVGNWAVNVMCPNS